VGAYQCLSGVYPAHNITFRPISAALLPKSFSRATSNYFERDIPTIYREVELDVMVETSTKTIPPRVPGFGLYYSEHGAASEKTAAPSVKNSGVSLENANRTRQFNIVVLGCMSSVPSNTRILICSGGGTGKTALTGTSELFSFYFVMVCHPTS
jgi:hypothetical protein